MWIALYCFLYTHQHPVVQSPEHVGPSGTVPEPAEKEGDKGVQDLAGTGAAVATERDIDVVTQPGHQRDMPAAPEITDGGGEIGCAEVLHQLDAEETGTADSNVGVAREVAVDLDAEEHGTDGEREGTLLRGRMPDDVHGLGTSVGHKHFLAKAPEHLAKAVDDLIIFKGTRAKHLRQQVGGTLDGTCHELREEGDVGEEGEDIVRGGQLTPMNVDGVAEGLKGIERDADGQDEAQRGQVGMKSKCL